MGLITVHRYAQTTLVPSPAPVTVDSIFPVIADHALVSKQVFMIVLHTYLCMLFFQISMNVVLTTVGVSMSALTQWDHFLVAVIVALCFLITEDRAMVCKCSSL